MSYYTQSVLSADQDVLARVAACAALEKVPSPQKWTWGRAWELSAQPGWDAAYAAALLNGVERPGRDESVISGPMILAAVNDLRGGV